MKTFQIGDVVSLTCGGPDMTVYSINEDVLPDTITSDCAHGLMYKCAWFDSDLKIHYEDLRPEVLILVKPITERW